MPSSFAFWGSSGSAMYRFSKCCLAPAMTSNPRGTPFSISTSTPPSGFSRLQSLSRCSFRSRSLSIGQIVCVEIMTSYCLRDSVLSALTASGKRGRNVVLSRSLLARCRKASDAVITLVLPSAGLLCCILVLSSCIASLSALTTSLQASAPAPPAPSSRTTGPPSRAIKSRSHELPSLFRTSVSTLNTLAYTPGMTVVQ